MITIKSFYIVGLNEAFYIDSFSSKINIIHSDDNDKGKTIVTQGMMYALGNTPIFPAGFQNFEEYYFIVDLDSDSKQLSICRKKNTFIVLEKGLISVFESVADFKRYFNDSISKLPIIFKDGSEHMVDPELFLEMSFLPQDKRETSNIINRGHYNKDDFQNALFSLLNYSESLSQEDIDSLRVEIKNLKDQRKILLASNKFLKKSNTSKDFLSYTASKERSDETFKKMEKINVEIAELIKEKNRLVNRKLNNESLISEINSLNKTLSNGKIKCSNCGCSDFIYESAGESISFNITDSDTRKQIRDMLNDRIAVLTEKIDAINLKIISKRDELSSLSCDEEVSLQNYLYYCKDVANHKNVDKEIMEIDKKISEKESLLEKTKNASTSNKNNKATSLKTIINEMQLFYENVNTSDPLVIGELFTKNNVNYSGSQGAVFLMSRVYAIAKLIDTGMPIIIDEFRSAELSSVREEKVIDFFLKINRQIILTCTLKGEENEKYNNMPNESNISFDNIVQYHLLSPEYLGVCNEKLRQFLIKL